jgi:hypothetical protein
VPIALSQRTHSLGLLAVAASDPDWPDWYALYMVRERAGEELPT